jgi:glucose-1-phosphate cytidylyltransferase
VRVLVLCGGLGTRLREETEFKPKPMVEVGGRPILWHIMNGFAHHGSSEFVLLLGYKGDVIRNYFLNYHAMNQDVTLDLAHPDRRVFHGSSDAAVDWRVTLAETGERSMTGARIARAARHLDGDRFMVTYGDGVSNVDIRALLAFHLKHGKLATVTGVRPASRFGYLSLDGDRVTQFAEKPEIEDGFINGGYFIFERKVLDYLSTDVGCVLERAPLEALAREGQLMMYPHPGFWQCMDTYRDVQYLNELWESGRAPWKTW